MQDLEEALGRARAGDRAAIGDLYRAFSGPVLGYLGTQVRRREDAEDVLGEVFLAVIRDLHRFEGDISGFKAWLYRVAFNRAVDHGRRQSRRPEDPIDEAEGIAGATATDEEAIRRAEQRRLWQAVRGLPDLQRTVIGLRLAGGLTSGEIAQVMGKRVGAVKALQHRALANLAKALGSAPYPSRDDVRL